MNMGGCFNYLFAFLLCLPVLAITQGINFGLTTTNTPCIAIGSSITLTCTSSVSPTICISTSFEWFMNGEPLFIFSSSRYESSSRGENVADLRFVLIDSDTHANFSCGLPGCGHSNDFTINPQTTPKRPVITAVNSFYTSISLNWTHNKACFESDRVEYHVLFNTTDIPTIVTELTAKIAGFISDATYNVSVTAVVSTTNGPLRSKLDSVVITTGYPFAQSGNVAHCFGRRLQLTCYHNYMASGLLVWLIDGTQVERDRQEFAINEADRTLTILSVSRSRYANRRTSFQCCVELRSTVCGEPYFVDPLEHPKAPAFATHSEDHSSISLSWEYTNTCFELVDFTSEISWTTVSGDGHVQAADVSGNSYRIIGLTPGVSYNITLVAIGDGVRSDSVSISVTTSIMTSNGLSAGGVVGIAFVVFAVIAVIIIPAIAIGIRCICSGKYNGTSAQVEDTNTNGHKADTQATAGSRTGDGNAPEVTAGSGTGDGNEYTSTPEAAADTQETCTAV